MREMDISKFKKGMRIRFTEGSGSHSYEGIVTRVDSLVHFKVILVDGKPTKYKKHEFGLSPSSRDSILEIL